MKRRSLDLILAIMLVLVTLLSGGLAQAYLAPDYNDPDFIPVTGAYPFSIGPGVLPDYLTAPNWAFSPILTKFVDPLPGLCVPIAGAPPAGNNLCASTGMSDKNIPVAIPDIVTYPGTDYYIIELHQYTEKMHSALPATTLRGYVQNNKGTDTSGGCVDPSINPSDPNNCVIGDNTLDPAVIHFLGPIIVARKDRPVRVLFRNLINPGADGDLFLPVDDTIMGAGPYDINYNPITKAINANPLDILSGMFSTNRATLHLHGGRSPWISDGTPHQWITPAGEDPNYPQGVSVENVPDMPIPAVGSGEQTFYWTNQQSSRFMFYHDHAWGITRLNVYAGEAAGYVIRDTVEDNLVAGNIIPADEIPLVLMDKTFVDELTIDATDPTWNWGTGAIGTAGVVTWVTVTNGGSGYDPLNPPAVTIAEGANTSATAQAVVASVVSSVTLAAPNFGGTGYVTPLVMIDDPTGSGATAEAAIDVNGVITGITVTNGGWGYTAPVVTIADQNNDHTPATTATATAAIAANISAVAITNGGAAYTNTLASPTVVTIAPPLSGTTATAVATVTDIKLAKTGDLWWPHVYMPAQNPFDVSGVAPLGRWAYGPYFYPATNNLYQPIPNPYYSPDCNPAGDPATTPGLLEAVPGMPFCQAPEIPSTPNPSWGAEAFMDTPLVNGTAYPTTTVNPKPYRFRILNAAHDRFMALSLFQAVSKTGYTNPTATPYTTTGAVGDLTEVAMIDASIQALAADGTCPATWPADGRAGGVPACSTKGPDWIMIGNEGGFLPMPVVIPPQPVTWNLNPSMFNVGNINGGSLILGPAERADVIVDFTAYAGKTLIVYNDGSAPWPALNPQYDFYTGNPDGTEYGAAPSTLPGQGPNTRTVMQIYVCQPGVDAGCAATAGPAFDLAKLQDAFDPTIDSTVPSLGANFVQGVFQQAQDPIIAAQGDMNPTADPLLYETFLGTQNYSAYNKAYGTLGAPKAFPAIYPNWGVSRINDTILKFKTLTDTSGTLSAAQSFAMKRKSIHDEMGATFDDYGRMRAALGLEKSNTDPMQVNFIVQTYSSPVTEDLYPDGIQVWKVTHNGVDTHPIHFHLFDVQVLNRVGWDGFIRLPDPTELGWKETVRISPLEDTIIAVKPVQPTLPFGLPTSWRPLNPATPLGTTTELTQIDPVTGNPRVTTNEFKDFAWEYVWHCHILSHEENDMMRSQAFHVIEAIPADPIPMTATLNGTAVDLVWTDVATTEYLYTIQKSVNGGGWTTIGTALANATTFTDAGPVTAQGTYDYRVFATGAAGNSGYATAQVFIPFHITVTQGAGGTIAPPGTANVVDVTPGANQTFTITPDTNFNVQEVLVDSVSVGAPASYTFTNVQADHTISASFIQFAHPISVYVAPGCSITPNPYPASVINVPIGDSITFDAAALSGFQFGKIVVDGVDQGGTSYTFNNVNAAHSIAVYCKAPIYTSAGAGGTISPSGSPIWVMTGTGQDAVFNFTPNAGYEVASVTVDGVNVGRPSSYTFVAPSGGHSISVNFRTTTLNIYAASVGSGTIAPSGTIIVTRGNDQTFTFTPTNAQFVIDRVVVDGVNIGAPASYTFTNVQAGHNITVYYRQIGYYIWSAVAANTGGTISPTPSVVVPRNTNQTFTFAPNVGRNVTRIAVDGVNQAGCTAPNQYTFINVTGGHSITVYYGTGPALPGCL